MRSLYMAMLVTAFMGFAIGCGGAGGGSGGGGQNNNAYAGNYQGEFLASDTGPGTLNLTITNAGVISGTATQNVGSVPTTSQVTGNISGSGSASLTGIDGFNNNPCTFGTAKAPTLAFSFENATGTTTVWFTLVFNPTAPAAGGNPLAGDYAGTLLNNATGLSGIDAWTISSTGVLSGSALVDDSGVPTLAGVSGTVSAGGAIAYTVTAGTSTVTSVTGNVSLTGTTLGGKLQNTAGNSLTLSAAMLATASPARFTQASVLARPPR